MIDDETLFDILDDWNYWNKDQKCPGVLREDYLSRVLPLLKTKEVIVISGVRRSGKSTFLKQLIIHGGIDKIRFLYINFDDYRLYEFLSLELLEKIVNVYREKINPGGRFFLILDEIQSVEGWEKFVKTKYDLEEGIKFIISGSNSNLMSREYSSLLTGRTEQIEFYPFSFKEFLQFNEILIGKSGYASLKGQRGVLLNKLDAYLNDGGFPEPLKREDKRPILNEYFNNIMDKDIIIRNRVRDSKTIKQLALHLLSNMGGPVNFTSLKDYFKISINTLKEHLSYLEEGNLIFFLFYFSFSTKTQNLMVKKAYCIDNGLRNAVSFKFSKDLGRLAENLVFVELKRRGEESYYWKNKGEVDFVVKGKELTAINVTYTDEVPEREIRSLEEFAAAKKRIIITKNTYKKKGEIEFVPLWLWLLTDE